MDNIVDLKKYREGLQKRRDERDCEIFQYGACGSEKWYKYTLAYELDGWEFTIGAWARSDEEARGKLIDAITSTLKLEGRIMAERILS